MTISMFYNSRNVPKMFKDSGRYEVIKEQVLNGKSRQSFGIIVQRCFLKCLYSFRKESAQFHIKTPSGGQCLVTVSKNRREMHFSYRLESNVSGDVNERHSILSF